MKIAVIESPYAGETQRRFRESDWDYKIRLERQIRENVAFARVCLRECLDEGLTPFLSHLLYTQAYDDAKPEERERGIKAGLNLYRVADQCIVYQARGISSGMIRGIAEARAFNVPVTYR